ncbi:cytoskeleton protein RodZ [Streptococcus panodentis]|uniref:Helix-turn-helix domain-containing protein n=1 Tax=Streptococcus panodentis TaxID=1581472 RepID=A0ABS5AVD9_9STRE|nr:cytoskeleton protein RodZ [Streptococcus panodentis]MBP2620246.1 helix-turn-helix domain-containing protein [Streptococcus panodentis]
MRKKSIGEVLKLARTNQGLTLEDLSKKTDIQAELLEAIEHNNYDLLPSPFYARSFLRKYAWAVDLDESIILEAYEAGEMIVYDEVELTDDQAFRSRKNKRKSSFVPLFYFLLLALSIIIFVSYYIWKYVQTNDLNFQTADSYSVVSESSAAASGSQSFSVSSSSDAAVSSAGKLEVSGGGDALTASYSGGGQTVKVTFSVADTSSWISVSDSDLAQGTTLSPENPSQSVTLSAGSKTTITLGSVDGVSITVGDQKLDTSAVSSDSATITLTVQQ